MEKELTYEIIKAACDGDIAARNKIVEYYSDFIDELSSGDEDMRQHLTLKLLEIIPQFDCENEENNIKLLKSLEIDED